MRISELRWLQHYIRIKCEAEKTTKGEEPSVATCLQKERASDRSKRMPIVPRSDY